MYLLYEAGQGYAEGMSRSAWNLSLPRDLELTFLGGEVAAAPSGEQSPAAWRLYRWAVRSSLTGDPSLGSG